MRAKLKRIVTQKTPKEVMLFRGDNGDCELTARDRATGVSVETLIGETE